LMPRFSAFHYADADAAFSDAAADDLLYTLMPPSAGAPRRCLITP